MYINGYSIAESLTPTYENVIREFITDSMYNLIFNKEIHNFNFKFLEEEALFFIEKFLLDYTKSNNYYLKYAKKLIKALKEPKLTNNKPLLLIKNYKLFFELLRKYYEKYIDLYFKRIETSGFPVYEKNNCFEQIWLRATPDDFNNSEHFLEKQVQMINDNTLEKFDEEIYIGNASFIDGNVLCVKNDIARTWDENIREFKIKVYDKKTYNPFNEYLPYYECPVIRYGIYEKNGKKICQIGSIQNIQKNDKPHRSEKMAKIFKRMRYKLNEGVLNSESDEYKEYLNNNDLYCPENISEVDPAAIFSLSFFINILLQEGITNIEIPSFYVLDYDYHQKLEKSNMLGFMQQWNKEKVEREPERYEKAKKELEEKLNKSDFISNIKTERFIRTFFRIMYHYPNSILMSYPNDAEFYMRIEIPTIETLNFVNNHILNELFFIINEFYVFQNNSFNNKLTI